MKKISWKKNWPIIVFFWPYIILGYIIFGLIELIGKSLDKAHKEILKYFPLKYIYVEQHTNGDWWYHPRKEGYYRTKRLAEKSFRRSFWWDLDRPHKILEVNNKFPIGYQGDYNSWYSHDCQTFIQNFIEKEHKI